MPKVGEIDLKPTSSIVVSVTEWKGQKRVDIRKYVNSETFQGFTRQGISIPIEKVDELKKLLEDVNHEIEELRK